MFTLTVEVDPELLATFQRLQRDFAGDVSTAVFNEATRIQRVAVANAPRSSGELQESAYVSRPVNGNVEIGFGSPYSLYIHERTDLHHPGGGEAKYLQKALDIMMSDTLSRMAAELGPAFERGRRVSEQAAFPTSPQSGHPSAHDVSRRSRFNESARRK